MRQRGKDNIGALLTQRVLPADSIHAGGGLGDWGQVRLFELEY
jgi:hypothetical protein